MDAIGIQLFSCHGAYSVQGSYVPVDYEVYEVFRREYLKISVRLLLFACGLGCCLGICEPHRARKSEFFQRALLDLTCDPPGSFNIFSFLFHVKICLIEGHRFQFRGIAPPYLMELSRDGLILLHIRVHIYALRT